MGRNRAVVGDALLQEIFQFSCYELATSQTPAGCLDLAQAFNSALQSILQNGTAPWLEQEDVRALQSAGALLVDPAHEIVWMPDYAVAYWVAPLHPDDECRYLCVLALDGFDFTLHRMTSVHHQQDTGSSVPSGVHVRYLRAWDLGERFSITHLRDDFRDAVLHERKLGSRKTSFTPGTAISLLKQALDYRGRVEFETRGVTVPVEEDRGGFRDVGQHTRGQRVPTNWALVEHAFVERARQEGVKSPETVVLHILTHWASQRAERAFQSGLPSAPSTSLLPASSQVNLVSEMLERVGVRAAALAVQRFDVSAVSEACSQVAAQLDAIMARAHDEVVQAGTLPAPPDVKTELDACKPLTVNVPAEHRLEHMGSADSQSLTLARLDGMPELLPLPTAQELCDWAVLLAGMANVDYWQLVTAMETIEKWIFQRVKAKLPGSRSAGNGSSNAPSPASCRAASGANSPAGAASTPPTGRPSSSPGQAPTRSQAGPPSPSRGPCSAATPPLIKQSGSPTGAAPAHGGRADAEALTAELAANLSLPANGGQTMRSQGSPSAGRGTRGVRYQPVVVEACEDEAASRSVHFSTVCVQPEYVFKSVEELRCEDYLGKEGLRPGGGGSAGVAEDAFDESSADDVVVVEWDMNPCDFSRLLDSIMHVYRGFGDRLRTLYSHDPQLAEPAELRSREALLLCCVMCVVHQRACMEWPPLAEYGLPVDPEMLRHLVLPDKAAADAALVVAEYLHRFWKPLRAIGLNATEEMASRFVGQSEYFQRVMAEEEQSETARVRQRWETIQRRQEEARRLEGEVHGLSEQCEVSKRKQEVYLQRMTELIQEKTQAKSLAESRVHACQAVGCTPHNSHEAFTATVEHDHARQQLNLYKAEYSAASNVQPSWKHKMVNKMNFSTAEGQEFKNTTMALRGQMGTLQSKRSQLANAREPAPTLKLSLPSNRTKRAAVLFFLHYKETGILYPLLEWCFRAQTAFLPQPQLGLSVMPWRVGEQSPMYKSSVKAVYDFVAALCQTQHRSQMYARVSKQRADRGGVDAVQLHYTEAPHAATPPKWGLTVADVRTPTDGVFWTDSPVVMLLHCPSALHGSADQPTMVLNSFADNQQTAGLISLWFTPSLPGCKLSNLQDPRYLNEPAAITDCPLDKRWLWLPGELSRPAEAPGRGHHQPSGGAFAGLVKEWQYSRGNWGEICLDGQPEGWSVEQWKCFTRIRAHPFLQMWHLANALREDALPWGSPQVHVAIRTIVGQLGTLQFQPDHKPVLAWRHAWKEHLEVLISEISRVCGELALASQRVYELATVLELVEFIGMHHPQGLAVATQLADALQRLTSQLDADLATQHSQQAARKEKGDDEDTDDEADADADAPAPAASAAATPVDACSTSDPILLIQERCALAHMLALRCHVIVSQLLPDDVQPPHALSRVAVARAIVSHLVAAYTHFQGRSTDGGCVPRLASAWHTARVAAGRACRFVSHCVPDFSFAMRLLFKDVADVGRMRGAMGKREAGRAWSACPGLQGCFWALIDGNLYAINTITGRVLLGGKELMQLPSTVVQHPLHVRTFGPRGFRVTPSLETVTSVHGRRYAWLYWTPAEPKGAPMHLVIRESERRADGSKEELELLPDDETWCPNLPRQLRVNYSHWLDRKRGVILFRGHFCAHRDVHFFILFTDRAVVSGRTAVTCYAVPPQMRQKHWTDLRQLASDKTLVYQTPDKIARSLSSFDSLDFVHTYTTPSSSDSGSGSSSRAPSANGSSPAAAALCFDIVRHRLSFTLAAAQPDTHEAGLLRSQQHCHYHFATAAEVPKHVALPLGLRNLLILAPDEPSQFAHLLVLVPKGEVQLSGAQAPASVTVIRQPRGCGSRACGHYTYTVHPRTGLLKGSSTEGCLNLALLYVAAGLWHRLPGSGLSGAEHALELVRQSWKSEPLSMMESKLLRKVAELGKGCSALQMLCGRLEDEAGALAFLHPNLAQAPRKPCSNGTRNIHTEVHYAQRAIQPPSRLPFGNFRAHLQPLEARVCMGRATQVQWNSALAGFPRCFASMEEAVCAGVKVAGSRAAGMLATERAVEGAVASDRGSDKKEFPDRVVTVEDVQGLLGQAYTLGVSLHSDLVVSNLTPDEVLALVTPAGLQRTKLGQELLDSLRSSVRAYQRSRTEVTDELDMGAVHKSLVDLSVAVGEARGRLEGQLLCALCAHPSTSLGHAQAILRAGNLVPVPVVADFFRMSLQPELVQWMNPFLAESAQREVVQRMRMWQCLCVLEDKLERCLLRALGVPQHVRAQLQGGLEAVAAELQNRRLWNVDAHPGWLALEVLNSIEIRERQYLVAKHLLENMKGGPPGAIVQLNMGEGKTRVILPMLVLALADSKHLTRLNFLQELLPDALSYLRQCLTCSMLQIKICQMPFRRSVKLDVPRCEALVRAIKRWRSQRAAVCVSREHRLSLVLARQELQLQRNTDVLQALCKMDDFLSNDILDESDEMLSHTYQLVYTWGEQKALPGLDTRCDVVQAVLYTLKKGRMVNMTLRASDAATCVTREECYGGFPEIRLLDGERLDNLSHVLSEQILAGMIEEDLPWMGLRWMQRACQRNPAVRSVLCKYCCTLERVPAEELQVLGVERGCSDEGHLLVLRGLLRFQLLRHCLMKRHRVDFGVISSSCAHTKMAVPFRACDVPAERAEYRHPDVALLLTHLAYYHTGLSMTQIREMLRQLMVLPVSRQQETYRRIFELSYQDLPIMLRSEFEPVRNVKVIDLENEPQMQKLHRLLRHNMLAINLWLNDVVLPYGTQQFPSNIRATAWHLAGCAVNAQGESSTVCGFSGTNDNRWLQPLTVQAQVPEGCMEAHGALGKMVSLILDSTIECRVLGTTASAGTAGMQEAGSEVRWRQVLHAAVENQVDALMDAGALLAGASQQQVATTVVQLIQGGSFKRAYRGVLYFSTTHATWMVMDADLFEQPRYTAPFRDEELFVIFDEARCRGSDVKLDERAVGVLTVGPGMTMQKFVQASGRLRLLGPQGQRLRVLGTMEVWGNIRACCGLGDIGSTEVKHVLQWLQYNTFEQNTQGLPNFAAQGYHHLLSSSKGGPVVDALQCSLTDLFAADTQSAWQEADEYQDQISKSTGTLDRTMLQGLQSHVATYRHVEQACQPPSFVECEREVQQEQEKEQEEEKEQEVPADALVPRQERPWKRVAEAVLVESVQKLRGVHEVEVLSLKQLAKLLNVKDGLGVRLDTARLCWPSTVFGTTNFARTTYLEQDPMKCMRLPQAVMWLLDGSVLLVSNQEVNSLLAAHQQEKSCFPPPLLSLSFMRQHWQSSQPLYWAAGGKKHAEMVALQLYAGETRFWQVDDPSGIVRARREALVSLLGARRQPGGECAMGADEYSETVALVQGIVKHQGQWAHYKNSTLEEVLNDLRPV